MPARFFQAHGQGLSGLLSGKSAVSSVTAPATTTKSTAMPEPTREQAALAALASQTLLKRLGGAFWEAFSGASPASSSSSSSSSHKAWDVDKVRRVLEGKAVVKVVDVEETAKEVKVEKKEKCIVKLSEMLAESMGGLSLKK
jgi:hypothetical protein